MAQNTANELDEPADVTVPTHPDSAASERIAATQKLVETRVPAPEGDALSEFARQYLEGLDAEDIAERDPLDLYGAIVSLWRFAGSRKVGEVKLRVFNPSVDEHGWQSTHTVVEIANDDMPFLVDSVQMEVLRQGLTLYLIAHPIVERGAESGDKKRESLMHVEVDRIIDPARRTALANDLKRVMRDVRIVVGDWPAMRERMQHVAADIERNPPPLPRAEVEETHAFLEWLTDNHFTFIGYRCHDLVSTNEGVGLAVVKGSGLGLLREVSDERLSPSFMQLPTRLREIALEKSLLVITKSNWRSTVHRPGYLDYIGVKRFDASGNVAGEHRFIGLYTSNAYSANPSDIPLLRQKVERIAARAELPPDSHAGKSLANILATYPRDELFQIDDETLLHTSLAILKLEGRQRLRVFLRRDMYERFVSCLIYAPRERYSTELRRRWQKILVDAFNGTASEFTVLLSESSLVRVLIVVRTHSGALPHVDERDLEQRLADASRRWEDDLQLALDRSLGEGRGGPLYRRYASAFPAAYREDFPARAAVHDIALLERALDSGRVAMNLYRPVDAAPNTLRFKLARKGGPVPLSDALPMLERMGLRVIEERPYRIGPEGTERIWLHDYGLVALGADLDVDESRELFEQAFARVFAGDIESDDFNRLVLLARLAADEVVVLRAYARYLRQIAFPLSQTFIEQTLAAHPAIARMLVSLFRLRFDPAQGDAEAEGRQSKAIFAELDKVANLNEDRVVRQLHAMIRATLRTNYWRTGEDGKRRPFLSFKLDSAAVPGMPEPKPLFEIFVYSARFEGVHLRGGKVARGGLRWSDRPEDFRTEVLGLVKAQMVKNVVIVPVGSKGGFVLKRAPSPTDREAFMKEGVACYQEYLRGLLDITDNRVGEAIVAPPNVRRHDPDDPYLVVAADKGTATFSDYANAISAEYNFWLGDAFASGGSAGYDHKGMGITARGAWESVKRHFRELGVDIQKTDFTVTGVGDMSGDVFGNGMLLSGHIRLIAAFDHRHVFIDPTPDRVASFAERKRLFDLPRSSWADYDEKIVSAGGGVWPRSAKSIPLSPQARAALGIDSEQMTPAEVIAAILKAPVDLLYNGGIGTYVKATTETQAQVGDRANDGVRVNGNELRCKVVAEGGNLGFTQLGRIEYAQEGGRIYTDAIDNSAGVDTSDHEVNLKILLGLSITDGTLTLKQRNEALAAMTDDVATLVLRDNYEQTQVLSVGRRLAPQLLDDQARFIRFLEREGRLDRAIEYLPSDEEIARRAHASEGLAAPERAVLLAYAKMWLNDTVLDSKLPDDSGVASALSDYFPALVQERFANAMQRHPLRREIIATVIVNQTVNRIGPTLVQRLREATGSPPADVVRSHLIARAVFDLRSLWRDIEALDNKVADEVQARMLVEIGHLSAAASAWFLRSKRLHDDMATTVARFEPGVRKIAAKVHDLLQGDARAQVAQQATMLEQDGVPSRLSLRVATIQALAGALDVIETSEATGDDVIAVASVYYDLGARLGLDWLAHRIHGLAGDGHWQTLAKGALSDDLADLQRVLTKEVVVGAAKADGSPPARIERWETANKTARERVGRVVTEVRNHPAADLAMLSVALRELRNLSGASAAPTDSGPGIL
ncbi:MAG TPA: NAD-glutamate dehydrogenase [Casimicrobiaceae bacterium]|nr:NAD-glutamate dehydrogenase [Casimicrobiaceae bacterium]